MPFELMVNDRSIWKLGGQFFEHYGQPKSFQL